LLLTGIRYRLLYNLHLTRAGEIRGYVMPLFEIGGEKYVIDEDGFMQEPERWSEAIAAVMAQSDGVDELTEDHWKVMNYIREYYLEHGLAPMVRKVCKTTGLKLKDIYDLFPGGPAKGACKWAGLPKPEGCV
jgi:tRNA 2-thiouridine synthesizing protein E